jgi:hypothetical protein
MAQKMFKVKLSDFDSGKYLQVYFLRARVMAAFRSNSVQQQKTDMLRLLQRQIRNGIFVDLFFSELVYQIILKMNFGVRVPLRV